MFKKFMFLLIVLSLVVSSFVGCDNGAKDANTSPTSKTTTAAKKTDPPTAVVAATPSPTIKPSPTESTKVTEYSIEMDFQIDQGYFSFVFGALDPANYLLWQINLVDFAGEEKVTFKPHTCIDGVFEVIEQPEINNVIKWEDRLEPHKIKVTISDKNEVTTYIDDVKVHTYTHEYAEYGIFGFRACADEGYYVDNIVIKDTKTDKVLDKFDFNDGENPFYEGEILKMNDSPALYMASLSFSGADLCLYD